MHGRKVFVKVSSHRKINIDGGARGHTKYEVKRVAALQDKTLHQVVVRNHRDDNQALNSLESRFWRNLYRLCRLSPALECRWHIETVLLRSENNGEEVRSQSRYLEKT